MADNPLITHTWDNHGELILTGSANAYVAAPARQINGYFQGLRICGKANFTNTGAATLNIISSTTGIAIGAVAIRKDTSSALVANDMKSGQYYDFMYDATNGWFQLLNPSPSGAFQPLNSTLTSIANSGVTVAVVDSGASGNRWGIVPVVGQSDGGMEIGDFIDFHNSDGDTSDFAMRLDSFSLTNSMTHTAAGQTPRALAGIPTNALASGQIPVWRNSAQIFDALAQGNSGEFLKSQGAGSVPVFTPIKQGQTVIASGSFPAANNLDITGIPSDIASLSLFIANVSSNTNTRKLRLFFSTNNGASYDTTLGNYPIWSIANGTLAWTQIATVSAINCPVMTAAQSANMIININNSPAAAFPQVISQITSTVGADGNVLGISQWFNGPMNALRITWDSTGNFDGGTYALVAYS